MKQSDRDELLISLKYKVETIEANYVTKQELLPIKTFVYGVVSVSLMAIIGGLLKLVIIP